MAAQRLRQQPACLPKPYLGVAVARRACGLLCVHVWQGCASARLRFPSVVRAQHGSRHVHAPLRKVASPDGAVGREWCYVEVEPLGRVVVSARVPSVCVRAFKLIACACVRVIHL